MLRTYAYDELGCTYCNLVGGDPKPIVYFKVVAVGALCATGAALQQFLTAREEYLRLAIHHRVGSDDKLAFCFESRKQSQAVTRRCPGCFETGCGALLSVSPS
jgi:hypothetical protein